MSHQSMRIISVTAGQRIGFFHDSGTINANDFNVTAGGDFENYQPIYADNFNVTAGSYFENYSDVESNSVIILRKRFYQCSHRWYGRIYLC